MGRGAGGQPWSFSGKIINEHIQKQHPELCRESAERFNRKFGKIFPMVQRIRGEAPKIMEQDGSAKMSESLNNCMGVLDELDVISSRLKPAFTDPGRIRKDDPGNPDICNIYSLHKMFSDADTCDEIAVDCRKGTMGCFDCKQQLANTMHTALAPVRERAATLRVKPSLVHDALAASGNRLENWPERPWLKFANAWELASRR